MGYSSKILVKQTYDKLEEELKVAEIIKSHIPLPLQKYIQITKNPNTFDNDLIVSFSYEICRIEVEGTTEWKESQERPISQRGYAWRWASVLFRKFESEESILKCLYVKYSSDFKNCYFIWKSHMMELLKQGKAKLRKESENREEKFYDTDWNNVSHGFTDLGKVINKTVADGLEKFLEKIKQ